MKRAATLELGRASRATQKICADCPAVIHGHSKRCKPCSSEHYDKTQRERARAAKLKRAGGGA